MYVYVISLLASVFIVAFTSFKVGAALSNRGRRLLGDMEATLCAALRGVKVPIQDGTLDEERSAALTLSRMASARFAAFALRNPKLSRA